MQIGMVLQGTKTVVHSVDYYSKPNIIYIRLVKFHSQTIS